MPSIIPIAPGRKRCMIFALVMSSLYLLYSSHRRPQTRRPIPNYPSWALESNEGLKPLTPTFRWQDMRERYPLAEYRKLPSPQHKIHIPKIQASSFPKQTEEAEQTQLERLEAVKASFTHAWEGYKKHAWLQDELLPIKAGYQNPYGGWGATLVDALGTLWMMEMYDEFEKAVNALQFIDFTKCSVDEVNIFETTIRYLGAFLSVHDLTSGKHPILLTKAIEVGNLLYHAFDTPNRMPVTRWDFKDGKKGKTQKPSKSTLAAEIGSLTLEFTRLSQVTGDPKYYDAVQRIMDRFDEQQSGTNLPGMWPATVDASKADFSRGDVFKIGGTADSLYEYLPKVRTNLKSAPLEVRASALIPSILQQYLLLGGASEQYRHLYQRAIKTMRHHIFYRPMVPGGEDILLTSTITSDDSTSADELLVDPTTDHLSCFAGGMVALGAKIFENDADLELARKLVEGCLWAYESAPQGIMPEVLRTIPCASAKHCAWSEASWHAGILRLRDPDADVQAIVKAEHLWAGVTRVEDRRYLLRPEAIESLWYLYLITGNDTYQDRAWSMFETIVKATRTGVAHAALGDCTEQSLPKNDSMESYWFAETLRYFYLMFAEPDVISLDKYVLNTEGHPLLRPS